MGSDCKIKNEETNKNGNGKNKDRKFLYITISILVFAVIATTLIYIFHQSNNSLLIIIAILFVFLILVIFNEHLLECKPYRDADTRDSDKVKRQHKQINEINQNIINIRDLLEEHKKSSNK